MTACFQQVRNMGGRKNDMETGEVTKKEGGGGRQCEGTCVLHRCVCMMDISCVKTKLCETKFFVTKEAKEAVQTKGFQPIAFRCAGKRASSNRLDKVGEALVKRLAQAGSLKKQPLSYSNCSSLSASCSMVLCDGIVCAALCVTQTV